uniref:Uncharacterized protein n=1 Tax=Arundo donax TaxID=35708 RepID=A0A0A8XZB6_ARUDO
MFIILFVLYFIHVSIYHSLCIVLYTCFYHLCP